MMHKTSKPKLLLDENMPYRRHLPKLNRQFDVKHISGDFHKAGISDRDVYELALTQGRLVVTQNEKDFRPFATKSVQSGIIGISPNLTPTQIDTKLVAVLRKATSKNLYGAYHYISGETRS